MNELTDLARNAEVRRDDAAVEAYRLQAQLDESEAMMERLVADEFVFHDDLELRLQGCFRRLVHLSTRQVLFDRLAEPDTDCDCPNCDAYIGSSAVMEQGAEQSLPFETEMEAVRTLEASLREGKTEVPLLKTETIAAYTPADLAISQRRMETTRDGPGLWALASLASHGRYIQPPLRAKSLVAARFGRTRLATTPATTARPSTLAVQPAREQPGASAAVDVKPHLEALRKCLGVRPKK